MELVTDDRNIEGTIVFSTVGRSHYGFDIFSVPLPSVLSPGCFSNAKLLSETKLTDGESVNYNGQFADSDRYGDTLVYISERHGSPKIYMEGTTEFHPLIRSSSKAQHDLFYDKPCVAGDKVFFASTLEAPDSEPRQSWSAVYAATIKTGDKVRLTPAGIADFSPTVSASGKWVAVASFGSKGWEGEIEDLHTDIYVMKAEDGSQRTLIAENGGWPTCADDRTIFFHRRASDGWWSVYRLTLPSTMEEVQEPLEAERVTPAGVHVFTPAASRTGEWLAVATRRPNSRYRHVEILVLASREFIDLTVEFHPEAHHYNPFVSPTSDRIGYHRSRAGGRSPSASLVPYLEVVESPLPCLTLLRVDGFFPSISPCGKFIAYNPSIPSGGIYVLKLDGSKRWKVFGKDVFGTAWDRQRKGVVYTSYGPIFMPAGRTVHIAAVSFDEEELEDSAEEVRSTVRILTREGTGNNAFPAASPDGKEVVFRSGRSGHKNLYIMDAERGEEGGVRALTEGEWTDTMPHWSGDGEWIAFSSNRDDDGRGEKFGLYMVRPDCTGLHKVMDARGRVNHVCFAPPPHSHRLVFTADWAAVSAEPISLPHQFQPYGELFVANRDGTGMTRLTHNAYEDGTPAWSPIRIPPSEVCRSSGEACRGDFTDCRWLG